MTGVGAVSPLGHSVQAIRNGLGKKPKPAGGTSELLKNGRELWSIKDLEDSSFLSGRLKRKLDKFCVQGLVAAGTALKQSHLLEGEFDPLRVGIFVGNCLGGWGYTEPELKALHTRGIASMGPYVATAWFPAALQGQLSLVHGLKGYSKTFSARDIAGLQAVGYAMEAINHGRADAILCGASEDLSSPYLRAVLAQYQHANRLTCSVFGQEIQQPFSEGAAFMVLEDYDHAVRRNAPILCEMSGFSDQFCPSPLDVPGALRHSLQESLGPSTEESLLILDGMFSNEATIVENLAEVFPGTLTLVSGRSSLGNLFSVGGVMELVLAARALQSGTLSPAAVGGKTLGKITGFSTASVQRLSIQGNITSVGLSRVVSTTPSYASDSVSLLKPDWLQLQP